MIKKNAWEENGLYLEYEGNVTSEEMFQSNQNYVEDRFNDIKYIIVNLSLATSVEITPSDLVMKAAHSNTASMFNSNITLIFVVTNEDIKKDVQFYKENAKNGKIGWSILIVESVEKAREVISYFD